MLLKINYVKFMEEISRYPKLIQLKDATIWQMLLWEGRLELELMLLIGVDMLLEFLVIVEIISIIMFYWLEYQVHRIRSKIHGVRHGEKKDLLGLHLVTHVEFAQINPHGFNDSRFIDEITFIIKF